MAVPNITVEVEFNQSPEAGVADTGTWTDISAYVRSGQITRGSNSFDGVTGVYTASTASVVLNNNDARFDPTNSSSSYWGSPGALPSGYTGTQVLPARKWRIRSTTGSGYTLWSGFADSWNLKYDLTGKDATCELVGTDVIKWLERLGDVSYITALEGAHTVGNRMFKLADGLTLDTSQIGADTTALQQDTPSGSTWSYMQLVASSGGGELYVDGQGRIVYRSRSATSTDTRSKVSQATFGDSGSELKYEDITITNDDVQLKNYFFVTRAGGTAQSAARGTSLDTFSTYELSITGLLLTTDADALLYAQHAVALLSGVDDGNKTVFGVPHIESLVVDPQSDPTTLNAQVLGRELGDRITVKFRPPGRASNPVNRDVFIREIQHSFGPATWVTKWGLQDATRYSFFVFDDATLGQFDDDKFGTY